MALNFFSSAQKQRAATTNKNNMVFVSGIPTYRRAA